MVSDPPAFEADSVERTLREAIAAADDRVLLAIPSQWYPNLAPDLVAAREDDVVVALSLGGGVPDEGPPVEEAATLVRTLDATDGLTALTTDRRDGFVAPSNTWQEGGGIAFNQQPLLDFMVTLLFLGHVWDSGVEHYVADPPPLPIQYDDFRTGVIVGTLYLRADRTVDVTVDARPTGTDDEFQDWTGRLAATRQQFVYPRTSPSNGIWQIVVRRGDERLTVGGIDSYIEDLEAQAVRFEAAED